MYVVDYDGYTSWMDTGITSEKSTFIQSNGIAGLCEALSGALGELAKTEEDVMSYICFPVQARKFLEDRKAKEEKVCVYSIEEA